MVVFARREVILAAGAIQVSAPLLQVPADSLTPPYIKTPALLQLSGVGDADLLTPLGIAPLIDIKTVGKNLQEQTLDSIGGPTNGFDLGGIGPKDGIAFPNLRQLFGDGADAAVAKVEASLEDWARSQAHNAHSAEALKTIFGLQAGVIVNTEGKEPCCICDSSERS